MTSTQKALTEVPPAVFSAILRANRERANAQANNRRMRTTLYLQNLPSPWGK